jgi:hypothetical protein
MDFNRLMNMLMRLFGRKIINYGIRKGTDIVAGKGKPGAKPTAADSQQANAARDMSKRARQAARITRRMGR